VTDVPLTNLDRVLWPRIGFTKGDLVEYYRAVADVLIPHLTNRAVTLWRFPSGVHERGWWQNECRGAPSWMTTHEWRGQRFCVVDSVASLLWVANQGTVELHPFLHRVGVDRPDYVVFDLDPGPGASIVECCDVALALRDRVGGVAKTSGGAGLHVYARADGRAYEETKAVARSSAEELAATRTDVVATQSRESRERRVLIDWLQNDETRSTVAPYSLRGVEYPTVSTPITWDEVERCAAERRPELLMFFADDVRVRLEQLGDLFVA